MAETGTSITVGGVISAGDYKGIVISIGDSCAAKPCIPWVSIRQFAP